MGRRAWIAALCAVAGCGIGVGRTHMGFRPHHVWTEQETLGTSSGGGGCYYGGLSTCRVGNDLVSCTCDFGGSAPAATTDDGTPAQPFVITTYHDTARTLAGLSASMSIGLGSATFQDTKVDTTVYRFDAGLGYYELTPKVGIGVDLGWEHADLKELDPVDLPPGSFMDKRLSNFDATAHLGVGVGPLSLDAGVGYTWLDDNGLRLSAAAGLPVLHHTYGSFEQIEPEITVERTSVGYTLDTTHDDLVRFAVLFRLVAVAPSRW